MNYFYFAFLVAIVCCSDAIAQPNAKPIADSLSATPLEEVVVISQTSYSKHSEKPLATLDAYLEKSEHINMIRRGSYAWEPFLNGMASERSVITIDGMRIYGACTDKMDPITSYVEVTNLSDAKIHSGASSDKGATIAGSIDLTRKKSTFGKKKTEGLVFTGYESNNQQKIIGSAMSYSRTRFFGDINATYRAAENYKAGGNNEILYSQFTKYNVSAIAGYKWNNNQHVEAALIYDRAVDVGYPALPMDVSLAKAVIGSVEYVYHHISPTIHQWNTKLYYNDITHIMDDTKRPIVPIRMDMPGWTKTAGFYSTALGQIAKHSWEAQLSGHYNHALAEMTMFSNNPDEKDMYMLTWPGVQTRYSDLYLKDKYPINEQWQSTISLGIALHHNKIDQQFGLESLRIFYPEMHQSTTRLLKRAAADIQYEKDNWKIHAGWSYGERAPSVSEAYGFYLFNSFDRFDYIGNPLMKNEKSLSVQLGAAYSRSNLWVKLTATHFYITDYIIGKPQQDLSVMTIGAAGVKVYEQLPFAHIFNTAWTVNYQFKNWYWANQFTYKFGTGKNIANLPLIQPFSYQSQLSYYYKSITAAASINGAATQHRYNPDFGEQALPSYAIMNVSISNRFAYKQQKLIVKLGVENILDTYYTTFADWNRLPRMGRNFFINIVYDFL